MKKFKWINLLYFLLFIQQLYGETNHRGPDFPDQNSGENEINFETDRNYIYLMGNLPSAQVFFNIVPEAPVTFSFNAKTKDSNFELFTSKSKLSFYLSFHPNSSFSRYCSAFIQIYLRTACFRL